MKEKNNPHQLYNKILTFHVTLTEEEWQKAKELGLQSAVRGQNWIWKAIKYVQLHK